MNNISIIEAGHATTVTKHVPTVERYLRFGVFLVYVRYSLFVLWIHHHICSFIGKFLLDLNIFCQPISVLIFVPPLGASQDFLHLI